MPIRITHPIARMNCAIAWFALLLISRQVAVVGVIAALSLTGAIVAGWKKGGGPPWWMLFVTSCITIIAFCIHLYPEFEWDKTGWIRGLPVALRLVGFIAIGVWTIAGIPVARLAKVLEHVFASIPVVKLFRQNRQFALAVTIAMASWGWLRQESDRVKLALTARNVNFAGTLQNRVRTTQSMLFIIIATAIRRADGLSAALYCRGWSEKSSIAKEPPIPGKEKIAMIASWVLVILLGAVRWMI
jgi:energy-coupling factor transporter transmembrane protein EcfT